MLIQSSLLLRFYFFFFFNDTATTEIYTLSLHDALPIFRVPCNLGSGARETSAITCQMPANSQERRAGCPKLPLDRKSTRLNSSHLVISYAVFCLKKKKQTTTTLAHDTTRSPTTLRRHLV